MEANTDTQPHFTYVRLGDSRDSVNNTSRCGFVEHSTEMRTGGDAEVMYIRGIA
jgi:hypothetical protein